MDNPPLYGHSKDLIFSSSDTSLVPVLAKLFLAGIPKTPVSRVAGAIFYAATDRDETSNGSAWLLVDDGPVFMVPKEQFKEGVYKMIDDRRNSLLVYVFSFQCLAVTYSFNRVAKGIKAWYLFARDIWRITGNAIITIGLGTALAKVAWDNKDKIENYVRMVTSS